MTTNKLILLPTDFDSSSLNENIYEVHKDSINEKENLIFQTKNLELAKSIVDSYNELVGIGLSINTREFIKFIIKEQLMLSDMSIDDMYELYNTI
jgi:hypothetical protein